MSSLPLNPSETFKRLNPHLWPSPNAEDMLLPTPERNRKVIRVTKSAEDKLNKTERRFLAYLKSHYPTERIGIQDITLRLAADCRYTPDFSRTPNANASIVLYDVKGKQGAQDDSVVKLKTAAALFPMFRIVVAYEQDGQWTLQDVPG